MDQSEFISNKHNKRDNCVPVLHSRLFKADCKDNVWSIEGVGFVNVNSDFKLLIWIDLDLKVTYWWTI